MAVVRTEMLPYQGVFMPNAGNSSEFESEEFQFSMDSGPSHKKTYSGAGGDESMRHNLRSNLPYPSDDLYFRRLGRLPLLSPEEESDLAKRISEGKKRIKTLLLRCPVGLEWIAQTAERMEKGEIRPKEVMEVFGRGTKNSESELKKRFISCAREILELCVQDYSPQQKFEVPEEEEYSGMQAFAQNRTATKSLLDGIPLRPKILAQLEADLRKRADLMSCRGAMLSSESFVKRLTDVLSAVRRSRHEIKEARDKLVKANLRFVVTIAGKCVNSGLSLPDLIQEGNVGLMKAVDRFDYRKGYRFCTYASWWILQSISRAIENQGRIIRIPAHTLEDRTRMKRILHNLLDELGRMPTLLEIAETVNMPLDKVEKIVCTPTEQPVSLEAPMGDNGTRLGDSIADEHGVSPLEAAIHNDLRKQIQKVLASLKPGEARILRKRFGIDQRRKYTMEELGRELGVSKERIRQIQNTAMAKLRRPKRKEVLRSSYH